jgi:hypothetical protein
MSMGSYSDCNRLHSISTALSPYEPLTALLNAWGCKSSRLGRTKQPGVAHDGDKVR